MTRELKQPIFIIGAARSGTMMLAEDILGQHSDVAYWREPIYVWRTGHAYRRHDILTAEDVTPRIRAFITEQFSSFTTVRGKRRFMEKTPSNCFRMPFILELFPDAKFLHILRDGRDVARSAAVEWRGARPVTKNGVKVDATGQTPMERLNPSVKLISHVFSGVRRVKHTPWSLLEMPAYMLRFARLFARSVRPDKGYVWGPRFPGMNAMFRQYSLLETCAIQWDWSVRAILGFGRNLPADGYLELKYEDLLSSPLEQTAAILKFLELPDRPAFRRHVENYPFMPGNANKWAKAYTDEELRLVLSHIAPTLKYLDYPV